jgi:hypothetical protein
MTTQPERSKCSIIRSAMIRAVGSSAACARFWPLTRSAKETDYVISSRVGLESFSALITTPCQWGILRLARVDLALNPRGLTKHAMAFRHPDCGPS